VIEELVFSPNPQLDTLARSTARSPPKKNTGVDPRPHKTRDTRTARPVADVETTPTQQLVGWQITAAGKNEGGGADVVALFVLQLGAASIELNVGALFEGCRASGGGGATLYNATVLYPKSKAS
jgi:hypothetical protein